MMKIQLLNKIAKVGTSVLSPEKYEIAADLANPDAIMVRSAVMHDMAFSDNLLAIARAGAGVNNIPVAECAKKGIVVFNTPGANANGVKELTIAALLLASRDIVGGIEWAKTLEGKDGVAAAVEKGKAAFAGCEIEGKTLGVIGLGAIGGLVANAAKNMGMNVIGYDPYITVEAAWSLSRAIQKASGYDEIFAKCDYITLHIPATAETKGFLNADVFAKMKKGARIINLSRADLVVAGDLKDALQSGKVACYVTDFPTEDVLGVKGVIAIPHLGASTNEAEDNCAVMAAHQLDEYLTNGNIKNSVNYPAASMPHDGDARLCVMHENKPSMLSQISALVSAKNINIENMLNRSKGDFAYTIVEIRGGVPSDIVSALSTIDGIIRVRVIEGK